MNQACPSKDDQKLIVVPRPTGHVGLHGVSKVFPVYRPVVGYRRRGDCEHNLNYLQLVTYNVVTCKGKIFNYQRVGSEKRLTLRSIGAGGHAECLDLDSGTLEKLVDLNGPLDRDKLVTYAGNVNPSEICKLALTREMMEEMQVIINDIAAQTRWIGWVANADDAVGRDHVGYVRAIEVESQDVIPTKDEMADPRWDDIETLYNARGEYEVWSQLVLAFLRGEEIVRKEMGA